MSMPSARAAVRSGSSRFFSFSERLGLFESSHTSMRTSAVFFGSSVSVVLTKALSASVWKVEALSARTYRRATTSIAAAHASCTESTESARRSERDIMWVRGPARGAE